MLLDDHSFRKTLGCFPTGVTVMTTLGKDGAATGVTISAFSSLSLSPPLVLFCLDKKTSCLDAFLDGHFGVNILAQDQKAVSVAFARRSGDKWQGITQRRGVTGIPLLEGCVAYLECKVVQVVDGGDHKIIVGQVEHLESNDVKLPLLYFRGDYSRIGDAV
ncbi:flavin reductase family protein [Haematospirillum jordaniae]|uniref:flavin reductase family protein n=1 Tax=Haematospirillum jordaniae TaxID=1549855 RepID=UPI00143318EF|nr:flavin reductase family protein [Haematospirillum jordaniae]NKD84800.1 flavin reductase family protein [Haematospirillum jordaniae]